MHMLNFFKLPLPYGTIKSAFFLMCLINVSGQNFTLRERAVFTSHKGKPENGGEDMCSQSLLKLDCNQGYTTEIGGAFNATTDSQYSITVDQSGIQSGSAGAQLQLLNCVSKDLGDMITDLMNAKDASTINKVCTEASQPWNGYVGTVVAKIPENKCEEGHEIFSAKLKNCKSTMGAALTEAEIALVSLLAICCVGGMCFSVRLAFKKNDKTVGEEAEACLSDCASVFSICAPK